MCALSDRKRKRVLSHLLGPREVSGYGPAAEFIGRRHSPGLVAALDLLIDPCTHILATTRKLARCGPRVDVRALITPLLQQSLACREQRQARLPR